MAPEDGGSFAFNVLNNCTQLRNITGFVEKDCQALGHQKHKQIITNK